MYVEKTMIWEKLKTELKSILDERELNTWFSQIKFIGEDDNELYLKVPDESFLTTFKKNYLDLLYNTLKKLSLTDYNLNFIIARKNNGTKDHIIKKTKLSNIKTNINKKYLFDNFVVGPGNQFAYAISVGAAKNSHDYNPIYIYGDVGLGKTHLLNAIANYIHLHDKNKLVVYKTSKDFLDEMVYYLQNKKYSLFKEKYKKIDVLIIDDIQLISTWEETKKQLFFIFNEKYEQGKQIIISSDCPPKDIKNLEERLRSRFEWGIIAQIEPPNLETRIAILMQKANEKNIDLDISIAEFIASKIKKNVRTLEGALIRVYALSSIKGVPVTIGFVKEAIKDYIDYDKEKINPDIIKNFVADKYNIKAHELSSKNNSKKISFPRQIAMYLLKTILGMPVSKIGKEFGDKHHTTVLHSINKIEKLIKEDPVFEDEIYSYIKRFKDE